MLRFPRFHFSLAALASLSCALLVHRKEKFVLNAHLQKRERRPGDPACDHLGQFTDADCLCEQLRTEYDRRHNCSILMLDIDRFHLVNRDFGQREGDRVLQAVTHTLLLNLRSTDLLCRYAGDRFAVLLPGTGVDTAQALGHQLRRAVGSLRHHTRHSGQPLMPTVRYVCRAVDAEPRQLLKEMNRSLERRMPGQQDAADPTCIAVAN